LLLRQEKVLVTESFHKFAERLIGLMQAALGSPKALNSPKVVWKEKELPIELEEEGGCLLE